MSYIPEVLLINYYALFLYNCAPVIARSVPSAINANRAKFCTKLRYKPFRQAEQFFQKLVLKLRSYRLILPHIQKPLCVCCCRYSSNTFKEDDLLQATRCTQREPLHIHETSVALNSAICLR